MADYILNMGGSIYDTVDVFKVTDNGVEHITDHGLTLSVPRYNLAAVSCGNYILAMGGRDSSSVDVQTNAVDMFKVTANGVEHITDHALSLSVPRAYLAAASCGKYVLAMGGYSGGYSGTIYDTVDVFKMTANGIEHITDHGLTLSAARYNLAAASCGEYVLAMGGDANDGYSNAVDVFKVTDNGIEHILDHGLTLSAARDYLVAASCGEYILAMGGYANASYFNSVDVFKVTESGIEHITDHGLTLRAARTYLAAASCGEYVLAMGGDNGGYSGTIYDTVDVFKVTANGIEHITDHGLTLSVPRHYLSSASAGNYILAMGGSNATGDTNTVDVFQVL